MTGSKTTSMSMIVPFFELLDRPGWHNLPGHMLAQLGS